MGYPTIDVRKSTPNIGAEIFGVDLSRPLGNQQFQEVHDALMDRLVVFFRDQKLTVEQQMGFGRRFGKLHTHPASPDVVPDHPEVMIIKADQTSKHVAGGLDLVPHRGTPGRRRGHAVRQYVSRL
jgi:taurine dioxygenase